MLPSAVALFSEMSKLIAVIALRFAKVSAIVRSMFAPVAILTGHGQVIVEDLI